MMVTDYQLNLGLFCNFTAILNSFANKACSFVAVVVVVFVMP